MFLYICANHLNNFARKRQIYYLEKKKNFRPLFSSVYVRLFLSLISYLCVYVRVCVCLYELEIRQVGYIDYDYSGNVTKLSLRQVVSCV